MNIEEAFPKEWIPTRSIEQAQGRRTHNQAHPSGDEQGQQILQSQSRLRERV